MLHYTALPSPPSSSLPPPRSGAASCLLGSTLYLFGGYGGSSRLSSFYSCDLLPQGRGSSPEWRLLDPPPGSGSATSQGPGQGPGPRENNGVILRDLASGRLYVFAGYNGSTWLNDLWEFDATSGRWTEHEYGHPPGGGGAGPPSGPPPAPSPRFGYVGGIHGGRLYVFGGYDGSRWLNDMWSFELATGAWTELRPGAGVSGQVPSIRSCPCWSVARAGTEHATLLLYGGYDGVNRMADFHGFHFGSRTWFQMPQPPDMPRPSPR